MISILSDFNFLVRFHPLMQVFFKFSIWLFVVFAVIGLVRLILDLIPFA